MRISPSSHNMHSIGNIMRAGIAKVYRLYLRLTGRTSTITTKYGFRFKMALCDCSSSFYSAGIYEQDEINIFRREIRSGMNVIDVGANTGYMTLAMASCLGRDGKVLAVEPNPYLIHRIHENINLNPDLAHLVEICPVALSDKAGRADFFCPAMGYEGSGGLQYTRRASINAIADVPVCRLDDLVIRHNITKIDFIKIDVEGNELAVLRGAEATLNVYHPFILFEVFGDYAALYGYTKKDICDYLEKCGYTVRQVTQWNHLAVPRVKI